MKYIVSLHLYVVSGFTFLIHYRSHDLSLLIDVGLTVSLDKLFILFSKVS